jgi:soluble lytic murein transglycosylase-like protein
MIAVLGGVALGFATQARAEGGEGPSVLLPHEFEPRQSTTAAPDNGAAGEGEAVDRAAPLAKSAEGAAETGTKKDGKVALAPASEVAVRATDLKPLIARYASEHALPYELADAVVRLESRYNAQARNGVNLGLTQVNLRTAQSLGYKGDAAGLLDAETNLRYGLKYLARAYSLAGGDTCGTILRYQFGHRTQAMTAASRLYCAKVKTIIAAAD